MIEKTPILTQTEVLVAGGGPAGFAAAVASARLGVKTLLVERYGFPGGMLSAGLVNPFMISNVNDQPIIKGVFQEVVENLKRENACQEGELFGQSHLIFDPEVLKLIMFQMLEEAGVKLLLHSLITGTIVKEEEVKGVVVENKSGQSRIFSKVTIDATGDGDVAAHAGADYEKGRPEDGLMQPMTLNFRAGGVEVERMPAREEINRLLRQAKQSGEVQVPREILLWFETTRKGEIQFNATRIQGVDGTRAEDLTKAEIESRKQVKEIFKFLRSKVPGFENSYLLATASQIGVRETRRIIGEYMLTQADVLEGRKFKDVVARGSYPIDLHNPKSEKTTWIPLSPGVSYDIPYRGLLPKRMENLLVAGRPISVTHEAFSSTRVSPTCMATGQAAGVAAALSVKHRTTPRKIDISELQKILKEQGADLG